MDQSNAINQIVLKLQKYLPEYGYELTENKEEADLIAGHAGQTFGMTYVDVAHVHGLYPTYYPKWTARWHFGANRSVINNVITARAVTVPSQWVADLFRRDMRIEPTVIGWAIDHKDWGMAESGGYVLWNKTRQDGVCTPEPVNRLAALNPHIKFVSTFGEQKHNLTVIGRQKYEQMREIIHHADVYLATTKETFGIGTLEAMACGIPILGFNWGGTGDIVPNGVAGVLVEPDDYDALSKGLEYCLKYRGILGKNAQKIAREYTWDKVIKQFAAVYDRVMAEKEACKTAAVKVSVVIPCYNYESYVGEAIRSVREQKTNFGVEIVVVDDGSTDASYGKAYEALAGFEHTKLIRQENAGVAAARNRGLKEAKGEFCMCLDADDLLGNSGMLQTLFDAFLSDPMLGIAYTGLTSFNGDTKIVSQWPPDYNYDEQVKGHNQVPTCCLFKKAAWERTGGYRSRYWTTEDADLWLRMGALGFKGIKATQEPMFYYRTHDKSATAKIREGKDSPTNWFIDKTWLTDAVRPFASDGHIVTLTWPVKNYDNPIVSFIVPVGPGHESLVIDALDSIENQTDHRWEVIVVNDTGQSLDLKGFPYARIVNTDGCKGAGYARNVGIKAAKAKLISFLDADDMLEPDYLTKTLEAYFKTGNYIYTDWINHTKDKKVEIHTCPEFDAKLMFGKGAINSITCLIPKKWLEEVGGFDEQMIAWEDAELFYRLVTRGYCGTRVAKPLFIYRYRTGTRREKAFEVFDTLKNYVYSKYHAYIDGDKKVCCGNNKPKLKMESVSAPSQTTNEAMIRIEYLGPAGAVSLVGASTKQHYGRRGNGDVFYMYRSDVEAHPELFKVLQEAVSISDENINLGEPKLV